MSRAAQAVQQLVDDMQKHRRLTVTPKQSSRTTTTRTKERTMATDESTVASTKKARTRSTPRRNTVKAESNDVQKKTTDGAITKVQTSGESCLKLFFEGGNYITVRPTSHHARNRLVIMNAIKSLMKAAE